MSKRLMLVIPNSRWYQAEAFWHLHPYPLALLCALLDRQRYQIEIVDCNFENHTLEQFAARVEAAAPELVGISVLANEYGITGHRAAAAVKGVNPAIITVLGGVYPTTRPHDAIRDANLDFLVLGEGELVFPQLLDHLWHGAPLPAHGLAWRTPAGAVIHPQVEFIEDLDSLPFPDYSVIDFDRYANQSFKHLVDGPRALPYAKLNTSRGCPIGCSFCQVESIAGRRTRFQSPRRVVDEIQFLVERYAIRAVEFLDDNFLGNRRRSLELFQEMIARRLPVVWNAQNVSAFFLSERLLDLMHQAGCVYLSIAVESGVERVLRELIHKPVRLDHARRMLEHAKTLGMDTTTLWVIGSPGETWDEIRTTIRVAEEFGADYTKLNIATPYPGTKLFEQAVAGGYLPADFGFDQLGWGRAVLNTPEFTAAELTVLRAFEWDRINFTCPTRREKIARMMGVTPAELDHIRRRTRNGAVGI